MGHTTYTFPQHFLLHPLGLYCGLLLFLYATLCRDEAFSELSIAPCRLFLLRRLKLVENLPVDILLFFYMNFTFVID